MRSARRVLMRGYREARAGLEDRCRLRVLHWFEVFRQSYRHVVDGMFPTNNLGVVP